jgi:hypothetical protein
MGVDDSAAVLMLLRPLAHLLRGLLLVLPDFLQQARVDAELVHEFRIVAPADAPPLLHQQPGITPAGCGHFRVARPVLDHREHLGPAVIERRDPGTFAGDRLAGGRRVHAGDDLVDPCGKLGVLLPAPQLRPGAANAGRNLFICQPVLGDQCRRVDLGLRPAEFCFVLFHDRDAPARQSIRPPGPTASPEPARGLLDPLGMSDLRLIRELCNGTAADGTAAVCEAERLAGRRVVRSDPRVTDRTPRSRELEMHAVPYRAEQP